MARAALRPVHAVRNDTHQDRPHASVAPEKLRPDAFVGKHNVGAILSLSASTLCKVVLVQRPMQTQRRLKRLQAEHSLCNGAPPCLVDLRNVALEEVVELHATIGIKAGLQHSLSTPSLPQQSANGSDVLDELALPLQARTQVFDRIVEDVQEANDSQRRRPIDDAICNCRLCLEASDNANTSTTPALSLSPPPPPRHHHRGNAIANCWCLVLLPIASVCY